MRAHTIILGLLAIILLQSTGILAQDADGDEDTFTSELVDITDEAELQLIKSTTDIVVVYAYGIWCFECARVSLEVHDAAALLAPLELSMKFVALNCDQFPDLRKTYAGKDGYPSISVIMNDGEPEPYIGPRGAEHMAQNLRRKASPTVVMIEEENLDEFIRLGMENAFLLLGGNAKHRGILQAAAEDVSFSKVPIPFRDRIWFGAMDEPSPAVLEKLSLNAEDLPALISVAYVEDFGLDTVQFVGTFKKSELGAFVEAYRLPLVLEWGHDTAPLIMAGAHRPCAIVVYNPAEIGEAAGLKRAAREVAHKKREDYVFVTWDGVAHLKDLEEFELLPKDVPLLMVYHRPKSEYFVDTRWKKYATNSAGHYSETTALLAFLADVQDGRLTANKLPQNILDEIMATLKYSPRLLRKIKNNGGTIFLYVFALANITFFVWVAKRLGFLKPFQTQEAIEEEEEAKERKKKVVRRVVTKKIVKKKADVSVGSASEEVADLKAD